LDPARRSRVRIAARTGRYLKAGPIKPGEQGFDLAWAATLRASALRRVVESSLDSRVIRADWRKKLRFRTCDRLLVFVVDASDSMATRLHQRLRAAKGAVLAMLHQAYQKRNQVALVTFGGECATVVLPPTHSIHLARERLAWLPAGGATPLAMGLTSWQLIRNERLKHPEIKPTLILLSDGEANVPLVPGNPPWVDVLNLAGQIRQDQVSSVVVDLANRWHKSPVLEKLAAALGSRQIHLAEIKAKYIVKAVTDLAF
jgi:magnesium chelatase subunit D